MYSRDFTEPPRRIIEDGKARFGTYTTVSPRIDIRGMRAPYAGIPLPSVISDIRIKSRLNYYFSIEKYIGHVEFYDFKICGLAEICFWNKETGKKNMYHTIMPLRRRFVPKTTDKGICGCYRKSRYIKVIWENEHNKTSMRFHTKGNSGWAASEGWFHNQREDSMHTDTQFVNPAPTTSRCNVSWFSTMKINGHLETKDTEPDNSAGLAAMLVNRIYAKTKTIGVRLCGLGTINSGSGENKTQKDIIFYLEYAATDCADPDKYNNNILVVNGQRTALPSVVMTHPFGTKNKWIIQDTESMIDLTFTPASLYRRILNLILLRCDSTHIYGTFEGVLLDKDGNKINLKNFPGVLTRSSLRI